MGQSWSRLTPVKMFINDSAKDVLIFGGGYDTAQDELAVETAIGTSARTHPKDQVGNGLYIVEATTGELIWSGLGEVQVLNFSVTWNMVLTGVSELLTSIAISM